jgi:trans-AT polyketide synthase, acyltransferase and oxidoreductase domains
MRACVFPGQGSQLAGMGEGLFERHPEVTAAADEILGYSVAELCLRDPRQQLDETQFTQPALYVVNALSYMSRRADGMPPPDFVAGHSLGEYNALLAAGAFSFEAGLRLVKRRGALMAGAPPGCMAAVLGCDEHRVREILEEEGLLGVDVANFNTPLQLVLAGPAAELARAQAVFSAAEATFVPLRNIRAAFHSRYMAPLVESFGETVAGVTFQPASMPVISNVSARPHRDGRVGEYLKRQMVEPVRWAQSIQYLIGEGVDTFEDLGAAGVLTKLTKAIRRELSAAAGTADSAPPETRQPAAASRPARVAHRRPLRPGEGGLAEAPGGANGTALAVTAERLGAAAFRRAYGVRRAYVAGAMYKGIASQDLVVRMGRAGYLAFFGSGGVKLADLEENVLSIQRRLGGGCPFGVNLLSTPDDPALEMAVVDLCLRHGVRSVEAASYIALSPALIRYRLRGLSRDGGGQVVSQHRVIAKVSRPEVAEAFLHPPPEEVVAELLSAGLVSEEEARLGRRMPVADDLCVEADSGGHTDMGATAVLLPAMIRQRDAVARRLGHEIEVRVGSAGGIGTPEAAASAFLLGADFILTGSINQCTVEAGISDDVKDILERMNVQDTEYAPAGDLFELGAKIQVLSKEVFFPARANRLYELWRNHGSWDEIAAPIRARIERDYFGRSFESVYEETVKHYMAKAPRQIEQAERDPHHRMALVFRWYFVHTMRLALRGAKNQKVNYQVHCGPALGAFNQWVKGTPLEPWRHRHVDVLADMIMEGAATVLQTQLQRWLGEEGTPAERSG